MNNCILTCKIQKLAASFVWHILIISYFCQKYLANGYNEEDFMHRQYGIYADGL